MYYAAGIGNIEGKTYSILLYEQQLYYLKLEILKEKHTVYYCMNNSCMMQLKLEILKEKHTVYYCMNNSCGMQLKLEILKEKNTVYYCEQQLYDAAEIGNIEGKTYSILLLMWKM